MLCVHKCVQCLGVVASSAVAAAAAVVIAIAYCRCIFISYSRALQKSWLCVQSCKKAAHIVRTHPFRVGICM